MIARVSIRCCAAVLASCAALIAPTCTGPAMAATTPLGIVHLQPPYPPTGPSAGESASTDCAGCAENTTWSGFKPGSTVTIEFFSTPVVLGTATADSDGTATFDATIPSDATPGEHELVGTGIDPLGDPLRLTLKVMVSGSSSEVSELPKTGADVLAPVGFGAAAVGVGALLLFALRRRSASNSAKR